MVGLIFGILFIIAGIVGFFLLFNNEETYTEYKKDENGEYVTKPTGYGGFQKVEVEVTEHPLRKYSSLSILGGFILGILCLILGMVSNVPTGHTGVVSVFGKVKDETLDSGIHIVAPWEDVIKMDNRVQKATVELSCFSSDIQEVKVTYTLNFQINKAAASQIYKTIGKDYYVVTIAPAVAESVKVVIAKYTAEELIGTREALALTIEENLDEQLLYFNIELVSTSIEDIDFTDSFTNAVEAKQVADQKAKQAKIEQEQAKMEANYKKDIAEIEANAAAEVAVIQAQADMEVAKIGADSAEYQGKKEASIALQRLASINGWTVVTNENTGINELFKADGTQVTSDELAIGARNLIQYYYTQTWDGKLPETYLGEDGVSTVIIP